MFGLRKQVEPEVLQALRWKIPDSLTVSIKESKDGGYVAYVDNLKGCMTVADTGEKLIEMVNDAMYSYLKVPEQYKPHMPSFTPPFEVRQQFGAKIPQKYLGKLELTTK